MINCGQIFYIEIRIYITVASRVVSLRIYVFVLNRQLVRGKMANDKNWEIIFWIQINQRGIDYNW